MSRLFASPLASGLIAVAALLLAGLAAPNWLLSLGTLSAASGLVSLGVVLMMRGGVVSFGQGLVFAGGGYAAALLANKFGVSDALVLLFAGGAAAVALAAPFAPLLGRYRGIFFAMLTLALSMVLYGVLVKWDALGGSDGLNMRRPTLFGMALPAAWSAYILFAIATAASTGLAIATRIYFASARGLVSLAVRENELRVEYLGASVQRMMAWNFVMAAFLGGVGGALGIMALGHIEPNFSYWTTSGEFVFVAILAGSHSVAAVFAASFVLELVRSFSSSYFPNTWQLALGVFLLVVIRFLPGGLGSLLRWKRRANA
jgi:branched-chain amino acid transport system permease protein